MQVKIKTYMYQCPSASHLYQDFFHYECVLIQFQGIFKAIVLVLKDLSEIELS